jgi:hypothetical protein
MTNYYPMLARSAAKLDTEDVTAREELYERARNALVSALRRQNPEISAARISLEQRALQSAIFKLEAELPNAASKQRPNQPESDSVASKPEDDLAGMPKRLAAFLFGITYLTAVISASGVIFLRGLTLVHAKLMPYPVLFGVMTILVCLLVLVSRPILRKLRAYGHGPAHARVWP